MNLYSLCFTIFILLLGYKVVGQGGALDPSFGDNGIVVTDFGEGYHEVQEILLLPDGKIIVAGYSAIQEECFGLARYDTNGKLDSSFGVNGLMTTASVEGDLYCRSMALQTDGKIILAGWINPTSITSEVALTRYHSNGRLDNSFGDGGIVFTDAGGYNSGSEAVALQTDGKIVIVGTQYNMYNPGNSVLLIRYNADGSLDDTFGNDGGIVSLPLTQRAYGEAIAIQDDGRIFVSGTIGQTAYDAKALLIRLNADGSLDQNFGSGGIDSMSLLGPSEEFNSIQIQPDDKILASGISQDLIGWDQNFLVARFESDGSLDSTFANNGFDTISFLGGSSWCYDMALQPDGKVILVGETVVEPNYSAFVLARFNSDGNLDSTAGNDGKIITWIGEHSEANAVIVQPDQKIIVAGWTAPDWPSQDFAIARYLPDLDIGIETPMIDRNSISISPNPADDQVSIGYTRVAQSSSMILILNLDGRIILEQTMSASQGQVTIDISNYKRGIYLVQVISSEGIITRKLVKQ